MSRRPVETHQHVEGEWALAELNLWHGDDRAGAETEVVDRSLNPVLLLIS